MGTVHELDTTGFATLRRVLERAKGVMTPDVSAAIEDLGLEHTDRSDGFASVSVYRGVDNGDIIELDIVSIDGADPTLSLRRYKLAEQWPDDNLKLPY